MKDNRTFSRNEGNGDPFPHHHTHAHKTTITDRKGTRPGATIFHSHKHGKSPWPFHHHGSVPKGGIPRDRLEERIHDAGPSRYWKWGWWRPDGTYSHKIGGQYYSRKKK